VSRNAGNTRNASVTLDSIVGRGSGTVGDEKKSAGWGHRGLQRPAFGEERGKGLPRPDKMVRRGLSPPENTMGSCAGSQAGLAWCFAHRAPRAQ